MLSVVRSRSCGRKPHSIWSLLAPSTYKYVFPSEIPDPRNPSPLLRAAGRVRPAPDKNPPSCPASHSAPRGRRTPRRRRAREARGRPPRPMSPPPAARRPPPVPAPLRRTSPPRRFPVTGRRAASAAPSRGPRRTPRHRASTPRRRRAPSPSSPSPAGPLLLQLRPPRLPCRVPIQI